MNYELILPLPQLNAKIISPFIENDPNSTIMFVLGGCPPDVGWLKETGLNFGVIWAADSGGGICKKAGLRPECLIGDFDSISGEDKEWLASQGTEIVEYPAEKDLTDYQLCLEIASKRGIKNVIVTGGWGGRFDHAYSNLYSALWGMELGVRVICLADESESLFYARSGESVEIGFKKTPDAFSLIALEPSSVVSVDGAKWNLSRAPINQKFPYAVSNKPENDRIKIEVHEGSIGIYTIMRNSECGIRN
ncbi:MAG: thiamine diphosphokinase [Synergistaceae bacterium]|nr:thiamine diphosphokinase [Synergistaceae bacterium]